MAYIGGKLKPWFDTSPIDGAIKNAVRLGVEHANSLAAEYTPVETGDLKKSWKTSRAHKTVGTNYPGSGYGAEWYTEVEYAPYVEHGTGLWGPEHKKYLIMPKTPGGKLHWVAPGGGDVYASKVMHPGSPGHFMLSKSAAKLELEMEAITKPAFDNWAREQAKVNPYAVTA